jgi:hypothetical protein
MGLNRRKLCRNRCPESKAGHKCDCPKVACYYVEFKVIDTGETLRLAEPHEGGKLKRWKVGGDSKPEARKQEAIKRTQLMTGQILSARSGRTAGRRDRSTGPLTTPGWSSRARWDPAAILRWDRRPCRHPPRID